MLQGRIRQVHSALANAKLPIGSKKADAKKLTDYAFHKSAKEYNVYWDVRKGLIPIVGAARETGRSLVITQPLSAGVTQPSPLLSLDENGHTDYWCIPAIMHPYLPQTAPRESL